MAQTPDHLGAVRKAAAKLRRAEASRDKAQTALADAIAAAQAAKRYRVGAIIEASGLPRATYYRVVKGGSDG